MREPGGGRRFGHTDGLTLHRLAATRDRTQDVGDGRRRREPGGDFLFFRSVFALFFIPFVPILLRHRLPASPREVICENPRCFRKLVKLQLHQGAVKVHRDLGVIVRPGIGDERIFLGGSLC